MLRNIEIKASVNKLSELLTKAKEISNSEGETIPQHDTFFQTNQGRLKLRKFSNGSAELIYYLRPDIEGPKLSSFEKCSVPADNVAGLHSVLEKALGISGVVKKTRSLFMVGQTRVHIDQVEDLGDFMELEVVLKPDQMPEQGEAIAKDLMKKLDVREEDLLATAYTDLLNS